MLSWSLVALIISLKDLFLAVALATTVYILPEAGLFWGVDNHIM